MALNWLRVPGWVQLGATGSHESGACATMTASQCSCCRSTNSTCVNARCAQLLLPTPASRNLSCRVIFNNAPQRQKGKQQQQQQQQGSESASGYGHPEAEYLHIPVLGVPLVSDPKLYLLRWLYSIDLPVHHLVIVTGGNGRQVAAQLDHVTDHARNVTVIQCNDFVSVSQASASGGAFGGGGGGGGGGVASGSSGWNLILSTFFDEAPWFVVSAHDVQFAPGALATLARRFRSDMQRGIDFAHIGWNNEHDVHNYGKLLMRAGLFDENIYPTFYEDDEFEIRTQQKLRPPALTAVYDDVKAVHGKLSDPAFTSGTSRIAEGAINDRITKGKRMNAHYVARKWGCGEVMGPDQWGWFKFNRSLCGNPTPFNRSSRVWEWDVDLNLRGFSMGGLQTPAATAA
ncbi:MAG: hypothetical protein WDW36_008921 [Sanguina aurantia]